VERKISSKLAHIADYSIDKLVCAGGGGDVHCRTQFLGQPLPETEPKRDSLGILEKLGFADNDKIYNGEYGFRDVGFSELSKAFDALSAHQDENGRPFEDVFNSKRAYDECYQSVAFKRSFTATLVEQLPNKARDDYERIKGFTENGRKKMWYFEVGV